MNITFIAHEQHADRFSDHAQHTEEAGDHGVRISLIKVRAFNKGETGRWEFTFSDGEEIDVPYGELDGAYDHGV